MSNNAASMAKIAGELGELEVETFEVKDYLDYSDMVFGSTCSSSSSCSSTCNSTCTSTCTSTSSCATA